VLGKGQDFDQLWTDCSRLDKELMRSAESKSCNFHLCCTERNKEYLFCSESVVPARSDGRDQWTLQGCTAAVKLYLNELRRKSSTESNTTDVEIHVFCVRFEPGSAIDLADALHKFQKEHETKFRLTCNIYTVVWPMGQQYLIDPTVTRRDLNSGDIIRINDPDQFKLRDEIVTTDQQTQAFYPVCDHSRAASAALYTLCVIRCSQGSFARLMDKTDESSGTVLGMEEETPHGTESRSKKRRASSSKSPSKRH